MQHGDIDKMNTSIILEIQSSALLVETTCKSKVLSWYFLLSSEKVPPNAKILPLGTFKARKELE